MTMRSLLVVLFLLPLPQQAAAQAPAGDPERGKVLWEETEHIECRDCHGANGEGGFGPDLAGRNLTRAQFIHAVRKPWGIMPAYAESQLRLGGGYEPPFLVPAFTGGYEPPFLVPVFTVFEAFDSTLLRGRKGGAVAPDSTLLRDRARPGPARRRTINARVDVCVHDSAVHSDLKARTQLEQFHGVAPLDFPARVRFHMIEHAQAAAGPAQMRAPAAPAMNRDVIRVDSVVVGFHFVLIARRHVAVRRCSHRRQFVAAFTGGYEPPFLVPAFTAPWAFDSTSPCGRRGEAVPPDSTLPRGRAWRGPARL